MMLLRAQVLALGHSGVRVELVERLLEMLNRGVHPRIPAQGSVGASGDLAPLAHLALALIGEGEASHDTLEAEGTYEGRASTPEERAPTSCAPQGSRRSSSSRRRGSPSSTARSTWPRSARCALCEAERLCKAADIAGAMSLEALKGSIRAVRRPPSSGAPSPGTGPVAKNMRTLLAESEIAESHKNCGKVQDAYSLRCMAAVHGAIARRARLGARGHRARDQQRDRQPERLLDRRRRRHHERRQLPRSAAGLRARSGRDGGRRAREHQRAPRRAARQSGALDRAHAVPRRGERAPLGLHDRAGRERVAREREQDPLPPGERRLDPVVGRQGGPRQHGERQRAQARAGRDQHEERPRDRE
jgi:hypothetical protein